MTKENKPNPVAPESYKPAVGPDDSLPPHIQYNLSQIKRISDAATPVTVEAPGIEAIILRAVDKCNPSTDGERFCLYNIIETAIKEATPKPIGDVEAVARQCAEIVAVTKPSYLREQTIKLWEPRFTEILSPFFAPAGPETWPQHCHLCDQNMESADDRMEWHGLGNCVPVCMVCMGSGIEPPKTPAQPPCSECATLKKVLDLVATDELFIQPADGGGWVFWVNVNDMFYPAADGEGIDLSEIPAVWNAWKEKGWPGVVRWVQEKRSGLKLRKSREETILNIENLRTECATLRKERDEANEKADAARENLLERRRHDDTIREGCNELAERAEAAEAQLSTLRDALEKGEVAVLCECSTGNAGCQKCGGAGLRRSKGKHDLRRRIRFLQQRIEILEAELIVARAPEHLRTAALAPTPEVAK